MGDLVRASAAPPVAAAPGGAATPGRAKVADGRSSVSLGYTSHPIRLNDVDALTRLAPLPSGMPDTGRTRTSIGAEPAVKRNKATGEAREEGSCWIIGDRGAANVVVVRPVELRQNGGRAKATPSGPWRTAVAEHHELRNAKATRVGTESASGSGAPAPASDGRALDSSQEFLALPVEARNLIEQRVPFASASTLHGRAVHFSSGIEKITYLRIGAGRIVTASASRPHDGTRPTGPMTCDLFTADLAVSGPSLGTGQPRSVRGSIRKALGN